jgi:hypothetical protein
MSLLPLRRWAARHHSEPSAELPAPGPFPTAQPTHDANVIIVVVLGVVLWLLAHGYSVATALAALAGVDAFAAAIASQLASKQPRDG